MGAVADGDGAADALRELDEEAESHGRRPAAAARGTEGAEGAPAGGTSAEDGLGASLDADGLRKAPGGEETAQVVFGGADLKAAVVELGASGAGGLGMSGGHERGMGDPRLRLVEERTLSGVDVETPEVLGASEADEHDLQIMTAVAPDLDQARQGLACAFVEAHGGVDRHVADAAVAAVGFAEDEGVIVSIEGPAIGGLAGEDGSGVAVALEGVADLFGDGDGLGESRRRLAGLMASCALLLTLVFGSSTSQGTLLCSAAGTTRITDSTFCTVSGQKSHGYRA